MWVRSPPPEQSKNKFTGHSSVWYERLLWEQEVGSSNLSARTLYRKTTLGITLQTFLPFPSFVQSAKVLDRQRLGKQRVETLQILNCLSGISTGWQNHPAVKMWRGNEISLTMYGLAVCNEWVRRGYKDTCAGKISKIKNTFFKESNPNPPSWLGGKIHVTHQSKLIAKLPEHYKPLFPEAPEGLEYFWPVV